MRYALYFAPEPDSAWWKAGADWLGRDPLHAEKQTQISVPGVPDVLFRQLTDDARRYGFHATLKAPFALREGFTDSDLESMASAFARIQHPISITGTSVRRMRDFLALRPATAEEEIQALGMRCVNYFDVLRAAPDPAYLAKRRHAGLSARQEELLLQWGYPYTEEEYRFHLTLTDTLRDNEGDSDADTQYAIRKMAEQHFAPLLEKEPLLINALTIFREVQAGAPFQFWRRFPFQAVFQQKSLPDCGRLFYVVGPSGAGKDSLLNWVKENLSADSIIRFARRVITRPAHESEEHHPVTQETFWQQAAAGHFCMQWQANNLYYGIRRSVEADLKSGKDVVVNGSREYLPQLRQRFPDATIIWIDASPELIRERVEQRQREGGAALLHRLQRGQQFSADEESEVHKIDNSGPIEIAGKKLLAILLRAKN